MAVPIDSPQPLTDLAAERRVLGILIRYPDQVDTVVDKLTPQHFADSQHQLIYQAILDSYNRTGRVSYTQVYRQLRSSDQIPDLEQALLSLTESFISKAELIPSVEVLVEKRAKRRILEAAEEIQKLVLLDSESSIEDSSQSARADLCSYPRSRQ